MMAVMGPTELVVRPSERLNNLNCNVEVVRVQRDVTVECTFVHDAQYYSLGKLTQK